MPPEGLYWILPDDNEFPSRPHLDVIELVRQKPDAGNRVVIDADAGTEHKEWDYSEFGAAYGSPGARILLPWHASDSTTGTIQLDFAYDEPLLEAPALAAIPRSDGATPTAVWAATPASSAAWKLRWLCAD